MTYGVMLHGEVCETADRRPRAPGETEIFCLGKGSEVTGI